ncbi:hypothetical protein HMPREF1982_04241 [Clostridiales bacterium oral taxon 876 str. F0540]|nr:hypothetical protein HMPREF1982_04241 [Clostridiales bacterium oral taxon 876 str. F0540]
MNKKFIRYGLAAIIITYSAVLININFSDKYNKQQSASRELNSNKVSASVSEDEKNRYSVVYEGTYFNPYFNSDGTRLLYSSGDNIYELDLIKNKTEQLTTLNNCYNPIYANNDNNVIAFARNNGIFIMNIKNKEIKKVTGSENPEISYAKPNFTPEGDIIYFKVTILPKSDGHGFIEKEPAIYKISADGKKEEKLLDGYNPVLSKDGKRLLYELNDNIYVMDLDSKNSKIVDSGKYAAWSSDGKHISYAKFERDIKHYTKVKKQKNLYIDNEYSNIYIADVDNLKNKYKITREEFQDREKEIADWANDIKDTASEQHFLLVSKLAYFDSVWSNNNEEIYVSAYNGDKASFELLKFKINNK